MYCVSRHRDTVTTLLFINYLRGKRDEVSKMILLVIETRPTSRRIKPESTAT